METLFASLVTELAPMINSIIFAFLGILATWLGIQANALMERLKKSQKIKEIAEQLEINKTLVKISVDYAEQIGKHLTGTEKFKLAKNKAFELIREWGINVSDSEVEALIEQAVNGYNQDKEEVIVIEGKKSE